MPAVCSLQFSKEDRWNEDNPGRCPVARFQEVRTMEMKTRVTEMLGIEYPIIQGGMAWVAEYHLAAGVSNAGGLGTK